MWRVSSTQAVSKPCFRRRKPKTWNLTDSDLNPHLLLAMRLGTTHSLSELLFPPLHKVGNNVYPSYCTMSLTWTIQVLVITAVIRGQSGDSMKFKRSHHNFRYLKENTMNANQLHSIFSIPSAALALSPIPNT